MNKSTPQLRIASERYFSAYSWYLRNLSMYDGMANEEDHRQMVTSKLDSARDEANTAGLSSEDLLVIEAEVEAEN